MFDLALADLARRRHRERLRLGTTAGGEQHPIDAGHYYMDKGDYPFSEEAIYAHEYEHLLGLSDEYSHSNPQMHALLHDIDPATSAARREALDTETVKRMTSSRR